MQNVENQIHNANSQRGISVFRNGLSTNRLGSAPTWARRTQQAVAGMLALAMLPLSLGSAVAQEYGPPPPPDDGYGNQAYSNYQPLAPEQLDQLVAPIALYPDSLVAQVLAASTYPAQVVGAQQFIQEGGNYPPEQLAEMANSQPWDPSVKSLVAFPQVVNDMSRNMDWTTQLGNAYYNQPQDVLSAVQGMRQRAYAAGNLRPTPQLSVVYEPDDIIIAPVSPTIVYVPYYNPWIVYGSPIPAYRNYNYYGPSRGVVFGTGLAVGFGLGVAVGAFTHFSWGYHNWEPNWRSREVVYNHNTYISNSVTVINHGNYGHYDRAPEARAFNQAQAARFGGGGNRNTINNVTVNRGGNGFNNGGSTYNRGGQPFNNGGTTNGGTFNRPIQQPNPAGNTYNRGGQPFNNGANTNDTTFNRGVQQPNPAGNTYNRGGQPFNNGSNTNGSTYNRGGQQQNSVGNTYNRGGQPFNNGGNTNSGTFNRPVQQPNPGNNTYNRGGQPFNNGGNTNGGTFNRPIQQPNPAGNIYNRGGQPFNNAPAAPRATPPANTGQFNGGNFNRPQGGEGRPQGSFNAPSQWNRGGNGQFNTRPAPSQPPPQAQQPQIQQHSTPPPPAAHNDGGHGGGGNGHDDHHR